MAIASLTDTQSCTRFFQRRVLISLQYWQDYIAAREADIAAQDSERNGIIRAISFGLDLDEAWPATYELINAFSSYMERRGYWETWNSVLSRAIEAARRAEDMVAEVNLSALSARLWQRQSRFKEAIARYRRTIRLARRNGDRFNEARACSNLGYLYIEQGHWHRAEVLCRHALSIFEQIGSDHGRAHTENHLGILYTRQRLWDKAQLHLKRACAIWQSMADDYGLMHGFINLGMLYVESKRPSEALTYLEKALYQARLVGEELHIGTIYMNMGIARRLKGEPAQAEAFTWKAKAIFHRFSNLSMLALAWENLGLACLAQEKWQEAGQHLEAALAAWDNLNHKYGRIKTLKYLVEHELALGNQAQASARFDELERLVQQNDWAVEYLDLRSFLMECRRSLTGPQSGKLRQVELITN